MARDRKPRTWVKIDCEGVLRGSINYLLPLDGQAVWIKMIAFSEVCGGRAGYIEDNSGRGLPHEYIAQELHCTLDQFEKVLEKMKNDGAIEVNGTGSIRLVNFHHYQFSEYDRQKPYRIKEGDGKQTFEEYVEVIKKDYSDLDVNKELDKFQLWWSEGSKELKRPKSAFKNWLEKARKYNKEHDNGTHINSNKSNGNATPDNKKDKYFSGEYGKFVKHD